MGEVVTFVLCLRISPTHAMEALRHEHERDLVEVKGIAVRILNVLVDATRHHGETETADQNSGKGREGQQMAICQWAPPAADENTIPWLLANTPPPPPS